MLNAEELRNGDFIKRREAGGGILNETQRSGGAEDGHLLSNSSPLCPNIIPTPLLLRFSAFQPKDHPPFLCSSAFNKKSPSVPPLLCVSNKYLLRRSALNKVSVSECYKPDFVPVPRSGAVDVHLSRPPERPPRRSGMRHTRNRWTGRPIPYFALHRNGFILPPLLPLER